MVSQSLNTLPQNNFALTFYWTANANGTVNVTAASSLPEIAQGMRIFQCETIPGSPAPTSGYSVALKNSFGTDLMAGTMATVSNSVNQLWPASTATPPFVGLFSLVITGNLVNGAQGIVVVYFGAQTLINSNAGSPGPTGPAGPAGPAGTADGTVVNNDFEFTPQLGNATLSSGVAATINVTAPIFGLSGTDANHYLYISGGTGTAEAVLVTGGTYISGAASGTIIFTPANNHSGAWTFQTASAGVTEALNIAITGNRLVRVVGQSNTIYAPIHVPANMGDGQLIGYGATLTAASNFSGASMMIGDGSLSFFTMEGLQFNANSVSGITTCLNFSRSETSVNDMFISVRVYGMAGGTAWNLDGCEDTLLMHCVSDGGPTPFTDFIDVSWHVPTGNLRMIGCTMFNSIIMNAQVATLVECTHGALVSDTGMGFLGLYGSYFYNNTRSGVVGNFFVINSGFWQGMELSACYIIVGTSGCACFRGTYDQRVNVQGCNFDGASIGGTVFANTGQSTAGGGTFYFAALSLQAGATIGTPSSTILVEFPAGLVFSETGSNNAIAGNLAGVALYNGLLVTVRLSHTLQAGANTFNLNSGGAVAIMSSRNPASNIGTAYAVGGEVTLRYSDASVAWLDISQ